jgi:hypothetical protein
MVIDGISTFDAWVRKDDLHISTRILEPKIDWKEKFQGGIVCPLNVSFCGYRSINVKKRNVHLRAYVMVFSVSLYWSLCLYVMQSMPQGALHLRVILINQMNAARRNWTIIEVLICLPPAIASKKHTHYSLACRKLQFHFTSILDFDGLWSLS